MKHRLSDIRISCYRQLRALEVRGLGDVNLIVGGNNSGKTTFLEALRVLAARGAPTLLEELLNSHGEFLVQPHDALNDLGVDRSIANLFCGRRFPESDGSGIYVGNLDGSNSVSIEHAYLREFEEERDVGGEVEVIRRLRRISKGEDWGDAEIVEAIEIKSTDGEGLFGPLHKVNSIPLSELFGGSRRYSRLRFEESLSAVPVSFVPFRTVPKESLADAWDEVVLTDGEAMVLNSLRLIEPRTQGLAFVQGGRGRYSRSQGARVEERNAVIRVEGHSLPLPLQAMGDGMSRVLQLVLSALKARNGYLLIDELENGLHYSVQERVWQLLFDLARSNGSQVFVTTHSSDCVRAFAKVALANNQSGVLVKMNRDEYDWGTVATVVQEEELWGLVAADIEVR